MKESRKTKTRCADEYEHVMDHLFVLNEKANSFLSMKRQPRFMRWDMGKKWNW